MIAQKMTYEEWYAAVDRNVAVMVGVSVDDLPDCCYRDWYDAGVTPLQAARRALKNTNE